VASDDAAARVRFFGVDQVERPVVGELQVRSEFAHRHQRVSGGHVGKRRHDVGICQRFRADLCGFVPDSSCITATGANLCQHMNAAIDSTNRPVRPYADSMITRGDLIAARRRRHLTQQQLADELGVAVRTVVNWEKKTDHPEPGSGAVSEAEEAHVLELLWPADETPLANMSSAALIAQMQQIIGILAARLEDSLPKGETGSGFGQHPSEGGGEGADQPTVRPGPTGAAIRGHLGMPPQV
jgi:DNA-binding transcriptional regulator YiaG